MGHTANIYSRSTFNLEYVCCGLAFLARAGHRLIAGLGALGSVAVGVTLVANPEIKVDDPEALANLSL